MCVPFQLAITRNANCQTYPIHVSDIVHPASLSVLEQTRMSIDSGRREPVELYTPLSFWDCFRVVFEVYGR